MIRPVTNNHGLDPLMGATPAKSTRKATPSTTSFSDVLDHQHLMFPASAQLLTKTVAGTRSLPVSLTPKSPVPGTTPIGTTPTGTTSTGTTPTGTTPIGTTPIGTTPTGTGSPTVPITYQTPFGTTTVTQPVVADFIALFTPKPSSGVPVATPLPPAPSPTPESVFGDQVWMSNPGYTAPDGGSHAYNPTYFASAATAQKVADMVGGKVVPMNAMAAAGVMLQTEPNLMVQLPDGKILNPGLIANYYNHGYPQSYVDTLVQAEIRGVENT